MTERQRRRALELAGQLARFAASLNDAYPYPPDKHHRTLEEASRQLLALLELPSRPVHQKRLPD